MQLQRCDCRKFSVFINGVSDVPDAVKLLIPSSANLNLIKKTYIGCFVMSHSASVFSRKLSRKSVFFQDIS